MTELLYTYSYIASYMTELLYTYSYIASYMTELLYTYSYIASYMTELLYSYIVIMYYIFTIATCSLELKQCFLINLKEFSVLRLHFDEYKIIYFIFV